MKLVNMMFFLILLVSWHCSSRSTETSFDKQADFKSYQYYTWDEMPTSPADRASNPLPHRGQLEAWVREAIVHELGKKGFTKTVANPDFLVSYRVTLRDKIHVEDWSQLNDYDSNNNNIMKLPYKEGTILIDIFDTKLDFVSWRGYSSDAVKAEFNINKAEREIRKTVGSILSGFPPR